MESIRTCAGCGAKRKREELLRLAATSEGDVVIDARRRMSGRGANLCPKSSCLKAWLKKKGTLTRAFRREVRPVDVEAIEKGLPS